jgi:hypothetical protein
MSLGLGRKYVAIMSPECRSFDSDISGTQEEIKSRVKSANACYHSVQNLLSSWLLSKNVKIRIYKTTSLPLVLYGYETWSLA